MSYEDFAMELIEVGIDMAKVVRTARCQLKLSEKDISDKSGVPFEEVMKIDNGDTNCRFINLLKVFKVLNLKIDVQLQ